MSLKIYEADLNGVPSAFYCPNCHLVTYPNHEVCPACFGKKREVPLSSIFSTKKRRFQYKKIGKGQRNLNNQDLRKLFWGKKKG